MSSARSTVIEIAELEKSFGNSTSVLTDFSLSVAQHELISIIGPSGCGKSTLLRLIAGLEIPTLGNIRFRLDQKPEISYIFQDPTLLPWATVRENIALPLVLKKEKKVSIEQKVEKMLKLVGLETDGYKTPDQLSGGMKMRVSLARGLILRPNVILYDEPFAALDPFHEIGLMRKS